GECGRLRPALQPGVPSRQNAGDRGLLQHDLADVDPPRGARAPRQVPTIAREPLRHGAVEGGHPRHSHPTRALPLARGLHTVAVMSSLLHPVGPEPASVYWRRRIVVILGVVVVLGLLWWLISPGGSSAPVAATASPTPLPTLTSAAPTASGSA